MPNLTPKNLWNFVGFISAVRCVPACGVCSGVPRITTVAWGKHGTFGNIQVLLEMVGDAESRSCWLPVVTGTGVTKILIQPESGGPPPKEQF